MDSVNSPAAEIDIDDQLVRELLESQVPELAELPLCRVANGWDNVMYRVGQRWGVRLPRREVAAPLIMNEARWLPELAPTLTAPVPAPVFVGQPNRRYRWPWTIVPWIDGTALEVDSHQDWASIAVDLGQFLASLHQRAPCDAPPNQFRGVPLADQDQRVVSRLGALAGVVDSDLVGPAWEQASSTEPWRGPALWIHGDLHPLNLVADGGQLAGVVDFGDITAGDPATDLLGAWSLFDAPGRERFRLAAQSPTRAIDDHMWERGRAWAIAHSLAVLASSADAPLMRAVAVRALRHSVHPDCVLKP